MPVALDTPISDVFPDIFDLVIRWTVDDNVVQMSCRTNSQTRRIDITMTAGNFITSFQAQTGTVKEKAWKVFLAASGNSGVIT